MVYTLPPDLTIACVASVRQELLAGVRGPEPLLLDPRSVTTVDAAGLQLLCALVRTGTQAGVSVDFVDGDCGDPIRSAMQCAGLDSFARKVPEVGRG